VYERVPTYVKDEIRCITEDMRQRILPAQLERRVYEQLRDEILSGTLTTGTQLVEARIATDLGVS
jgi:DNA-binding GntR family transcriptional regulator